MLNERRWASHRLGEFATQREQGEINNFKFLEEKITVELEEEHRDVSTKHAAPEIGNANSVLQQHR